MEPLPASILPKTCSRSRKRPASPSLTILAASLRQFYRELERGFSVGDRIQFTAPDKSLGVANRDLAVIGVH